MAFEHKRIQNPPQINCYDEAERRADYEAHSGRHYIWPSSAPPIEARVPLYRFYVSDDDELYFVNDSEEVIDRVSYATGGSRPAMTMLLLSILLKTAGMSI